MADYSNLDWGSFGLGPLFQQSQAPRVQGSGTFAGYSSPMSGFSGPAQTADTANDIVVTAPRVAPLSFEGAELNIPQVDLSSLTSSLPDLSALSAGGKTGGGGGGGGDKEGTFNGMDYAKLGLQGINTVGNLYAAFKTLSLANKQFKYQKGVTDTNLANQISSYNSALQDKITARAKVQGMSDADRDKLIEDRKAVRKF